MSNCLTNVSLFIFLFSFLGGDYYPLGLYMVAVDRQIKNRERMMAENLKAMEGEGGGEDVWILTYINDEMLLTTFWRASPSFQIGPSVYVKCFLNFFFSLWKFLNPFSPLIWHQFYWWHRVFFLFYFRRMIVVCYK